VDIALAVVPGAVAQLRRVGAYSSPGHRWGPLAAAARGA